uniref:NADH-ubiquinone oxidoreductase chain 3 n=1 Tax=Rhabditophanes sp. KR3021 TaxID=114890 RepID=A0AC35UIS3_9BILA
FVLTLVFIVLFYIVNFFLRVKLETKNKISAFERGFCRVGLLQNSFSIHFFIIILIFVIFDLEIVIFLGILISDLNSLLSFFILIFFVLLAI